MEALYVIIGLLAAIIIIVIYRTMTFKTPKVNLNKKVYAPGKVSEGAIERLCEAISIKSVSNFNYQAIDFKEFEKFIEFMESKYLKAHKTMEQMKISEYSLVYKWKGKDKNKKPILLMGHYDVVPVEGGTEEDWKYTPFSGAVAEGKIWGRGTLDIKCQVIALMETAEKLIGEGYIPERDIYFAFGHDEEVGGAHGARVISKYFYDNGIEFDGVYDEGGLVVSGAISGVKSPIALIGVGEKGFCNISIKVEESGGHASMPPKHTALGKFSEIICDIEKNSMKPRITAPVNELLKNICGEMGFLVKMAVANQWLFRPVLLKVLSRSAATNAMVRTTIAPTMVKGSDAANVLPQKVEGVVNCRVLQGDTCEALMKHLNSIGKKHNAVIKPLLLEEPSPISPINTHSYSKLIETIEGVYPNAISTPFLLMAGTDSSKYYNVCDNIYRFTPIWITDEERGTIHSTNESISIENYGRMLHFYEQFIRNYDK